MLEKDD
jgi:predicted DNA-binding WGR domain protein